MIGPSPGAGQPYRHARCGRGCDVVVSGPHPIMDDRIAMTRRAPSDHLPTDMPERPGFPGAPAAERQFGIGQSVHRREDPILVQGQGRYTDDLSLPGQLHAVFVRSPYAHGVLNGVRRVRRARRAGRARRLHGARPRGLRHLPERLRIQERRRLHHGEAETRRARDRQGALRRRSGRLRGGRECGRRPGRARRPWRSTSSSCPPP